MSPRLPPFLTSEPSGRAAQSAGSTIPWKGLSRVGFSGNLPCLGKPLRHGLYAARVISIRFSDAQSHGASG